MLTVAERRPLAAAPVRRSFSPASSTSLLAINSSDASAGTVIVLAIRDSSVLLLSVIFAVMSSELIPSTFAIKQLSTIDCVADGQV